MEDKVKILSEALKWFLPKAEFFDSISLLSNDEEPQYHFLVAPRENNIFEKGKYFFKNDSLPIHFTNLEAVKSIIISKSIRLYNFNNMDDPLEYAFSANIFEGQNEILADARENIFSISFCSEKLLNKKREHDQFNQWRLYGRNGKGVCIVFSLNNDPKGWIDHHMSKVHYAKATNGKSHSGFGKIRVLLEKLNKTEPKINFDFGKLFCFHKSFLYANEEEIRLIFDGREKRYGCGFTKYFKNNNLIYPIVDSDEVKSKQNKKVKYLNLSLNVNTLPNNIEIPILKIEKIIIGYAYTLKEHNQIINELKKLSSQNLNYLPKFERSKLSMQYWGENK
jgi:hypothetical protein